MQRHFLLAIAVLIAAWLVGLPPGSWTIDSPGNYWPIRGTLVLGMGFLAIACMALAMILAARPARLETLLGGLDQFYRLHKRLGIAGALFGLAHWRHIPYHHYFARLHRLLPIAYLLLVFHSLVLLPRNYWSSLGGPLAALLMAGGTIAAVLSLAGRIGCGRRALGHGDAIRLHDDRVLEVHCQLEALEIR